MFREKANCLYFLKLYDKYIEPIAETFAWCLMPNHFHVLVRIKEEADINFIPRKQKPLSGHKAADRIFVAKTLSAVENPDSGLYFKQEKKYKPSNQFSHLFNSYAQAFNKKYNRHGGLFESPFRRILIDSEKYYKNLVIYIHNNPVIHGFVEDTVEYPWTSYLTVSSDKPTKLKREEILDWFEDIDNFRYLHKIENDNALIEQYFIE